MPVDHYENFPVASLLLPLRLRAPVETIYRFARCADDIADEGNALPAERLEQLATFHRTLETIAAGSDPADPRFPDLSAVINGHQLPIQLFHDLITAFEQDVTVTRYGTHADVLDYCRRSANPVGRLLLHLVGETGTAALEESDRVCTALQLINFLQDVAIDWAKDRIYLPREDLDRFGIDESQFESAKWSPTWAAMMDFQVDRARRTMLGGASLLRRLQGRMRWEIRATMNGGLRILDRIQHVRGDVFRERPTLNKRDWLWIAGRTLAGNPG